MKDRIPKYPGRVKLIPVPGQEGVYDLERADEPVEAGTALNKATLLQDFTAEFLGLNPATNPTVNDAFIASVLSSKNACFVKLIVTVGGKPAKAGIKINGLTNLAGGELFTESDGTAYGLTTTASTTISSENYVDMPSRSIGVSTPIKSIVSATLVIPAPVNNTVRYDSSRSIKFSPYVTGVDVSCVGGGGGGGGAWYTRESGGGVGGGTGGGGGGGRVTNQYNVPFEAGVAYQLIVGSGGSKGRSYEREFATNGGDGGTSSLLGVTALGGAGGRRGNAVSGEGGAGNGNGGRGTSGASATTHPLSGAAGGGGGSGTTYDKPLAGGSPCGGSGAYVISISQKTKVDASNGAVPGGGGGGGACGFVMINNVGDFVIAEAAGGGRGAVYVRYRVKV